MTCRHRVLYKGTHESFLKGLWMCGDCGQFVELPQGYGVVFMALREMSLRGGE